MQAQARTVETFGHGTLPVLDVWKQCRHTETGWIGVDEKGQRVNMCYRPEDERRWGPARMPPKDYVIVRDARGAPIGAVVIERARRQEKR